jgi:hypothetical protein
LGSNTHPWTSNHEEIVNSPKQARIAANREAAKLRLSKRLHTLSVAFLRAEATWEQFLEDLNDWMSTGETEEQAIAGILPAIRQVKNTKFTRASGMLSLHLAFLFAVVERWKKWQFSDPGVDALLAQPELERLEEFRHTIFHADSFEQMARSPLMTEREGARWCRQLATALEIALHEWHTAFDLKFEEYYSQSNRNSGK